MKRVISLKFENSILEPTLLHHQHNLTCKYIDQEIKRDYSSIVRYISNLNNIGIGAWVAMEQDFKNIFGMVLSITIPNWTKNMIDFCSSISIYDDMDDDGNVNEEGDRWVEMQIGSIDVPGLLINETNNHELIHLDEVCIIFNMMHYLIEQE